MDNIIKSTIDLSAYKKQAGLLKNVLEVDLSAIKPGAIIRYRLTAAIVSAQAERERKKHEELISTIKGKLSSLGKKTANIKPEELINIFMAEVAGEEVDRLFFENKFEKAEEFLYSFDVVTKEEVKEWFATTYEEDETLTKQPYEHLVMNIYKEYEDFVQEYMITPSKK